MSEVKFNNGKWMVSTVGLVENTICQLSSKVCVYSDKRVDDDAIPDANLIAAAPEMYEKLNEISDGLLDSGGSGNVRLAIEINNLLTKARGESC